MESKIKNMSRSDMVLYKINSSIKLSKIQTNKSDILIFCVSLGTLEDEGKSEILNSSVNGKERNSQIKNKLRRYCKKLKNC